MGIPSAKRSASAAVGRQADRPAEGIKEPWHVWNDAYWGYDHCTDLCDLRTDRSSAPLAVHGDVVSPRGCSVPGGARREVLGDIAS